MSSISDRATDRPSGRATDRQRDRQTELWIDMQIDREKNRRACRALRVIPGGNQVDGLPPASSRADPRNSRFCSSSNFQLGEYHFWRAQVEGVKKRNFERVLEINSDYEKTQRPHKIVSFLLNFHMDLVIGSVGQAWNSGMLASTFKIWPILERKN